MLVFLIVTVSAFRFLGEILEETVYIIYNQPLFIILT